jgi:DNA polymerase I/DNA polymerase-2
MDWRTEKILNEAKVLIFDIETTSLDVDEAITRVVGVRTNKSDKVHCIWAKDFHKLKKAIRGSDFIIGYNTDNYDIPVLMNEHTKLFKYASNLTSKSIDLKKVVEARESTFGVPFLNGFSLDAVCETLGLNRKQEDFDYNLLKKEYEELTAEEIAEIEKYLTQDINITYELYQFIYDMWEPMAEFMTEYDVKKFNFMRSSMGSMTYKILCNMANLEPRFAGEDDEEDSGYKGGHVFEPSMEEARGNIVCVDYASAYPHAYMQANLYTKCTHCKEGDCQYRFTGGVTPDGHELKLQGQYCTRHGMGVRERAIRKLYMMRVAAKTEIKSLKLLDELIDEQEHRLNYLEKLQQGLKIVINTIYGISGSPKFLSTYDEDTSADCTRICRFNLIYMHSKLEEFGLKCLYGDTDSAYVLGADDLTDEQLQAYLDEILANLKSIYPFPQDTFFIDIEDHIKYMQFFSDGFGGFKKKFYLMVLENGDVKVKGLPVVKRDCSILARRIWTDNIKPYVAENLKGKVPLSQIEIWVEDLITEDIENAAVEFNVKPLEAYRCISSIQSRISSELGEGKHKLIKNRRGIGIGTGVKYATVEQAKELGFTISDIDLSRVFSNLSDLTDDGQTNFNRFM